MGKVFKDSDFCCNGNCNQSRSCPALRTSKDVQALIDRVEANSGDRVVLSDEEMEYLEKCKTDEKWFLWACGSITAAYVAGFVLWALNSRGISPADLLEILGAML